MGIKNDLTFVKFKNDIYDSIKGVNHPIVIKVIFIDGEIKISLRHPSYTKEHYENGLRLCISKERKAKSILNHIKTFNYGQNYIEDLRAKIKDMIPVYF
ncbi:hypothetical protein PL321_01030 [Caloramator sp. mosi_1]|nr:hypothetical protein [Caloramator sp. mosi_1]WDC84435.1 hypothetical protein PL321_01030 [Caloramator sp. mosi_1]